MRADSPCTACVRFSCGLQLFLILFIILRRAAKLKLSLPLLSLGPDICDSSERAYKSFEQVFVQHAFLLRAVGMNRRTQPIKAVSR